MSDTTQINIQLERDGEEPLYRQIIRSIRAQIESGVLPVETRLPASRDLANQLNISRISVVNAYAELRAQGLLSAHAGRGTFVANDGNTFPASNIRDRSSLGGTPAANHSLRDMMRLARKPGVISFSNGSPPSEFFPIRPLRDAINSVLDRDGATALSYEVTEGYGPLRAAVRDYVSALGIQCYPSQVFITGGTQQALDLVIQSLLSENDTIVTATPTYIGMIDIARARRIQIHDIDSNQDGINLDYLENYLSNNRPKLIYVIPSFQNPTGHVMPLYSRRRLLNLARSYNVPILEDAVYHEFRFEGESLPPLKALDEHGIVIHASGFTKMLLPGMRIGYIIADGSYHRRLINVKRAADISTPGLNQRAIHLLLEQGILASQLERNNRKLLRRRNAALEAMERYLPPETRWSIPQGGLFLWAELPHSGPTAAELYISAIQNGVAYAIGNVFFADGSGSYYIRLNYGAHSPDRIKEGFRRLGDAWQELASDYAEMDKSPLL